MYIDKWIYNWLCTYSNDYTIDYTQPNDYTIDYIHRQMIIQLPMCIVKLLYNWLCT